MRRRVLHRSRNEYSRFNITLSQTVTIASLSNSATGNARGLYISPNGDYICMSFYGSPDTVSTALLGTNYDIEAVTSAVFNSALNSQSYGITFSPDGTKLFNAQLDSAIMQANVTNPFYSSPRGTITSKAMSGNYILTIDFDPTGTIMYLCKRTSGIQRWELSTPWNITTAAVISSETIDRNGIKWIKEGKQAIVFNSNSNLIELYTMITEYDFSSRTLKHTESITGTGSDFNVMGYGNSDDYIFIINGTNVQRYDLELI